MSILSRRKFLLIVGLLPAVGASNIDFSLLSKISKKSKNKDDFSIVNGWVLKKSDLL